MPKVNYDGITFDSDLEVEYYKKLMDDRDVKFFSYHPRKPIQITRNNFYTPDFVVFYNDRIEIIETKGYNPYSKMKDDMTHNIMLQKNEQELRDWVSSNYDFTLNGMPVNCNSFRVVYRKIKFLQAYGFVDWDFKNPNTQINKARNKIKTQKEELKELKEFKKNALRYWGYVFNKIDYKVNLKKLTKTQKEWFENYVAEMAIQVQEGSK